MTNPGFVLRFDGNESRKHPNGYWSVRTNDGNWDAVGSTPLDALANLVTELHETLILATWENRD